MQALEVEEDEPVWSDDSQAEGEYPTTSVHSTLD
jgi:hypothetical protein